MFELVECSIDECRIPAVTGSQRCMLHTDKKEELTAHIGKRLIELDTIAGISASYITVGGMALSQKRLRANGFSHGAFTNIDFSSSSFRLVFFDFCTFRNCNLRGVDMKYTVFAGATLESCDFSSSDILHCNFNGITATKCVFDESDFYYSTFAHSKIIDSSFIDCNLKKVRFNNTERTHVSFKYSNYEEAYFGESAEQ